MKNKQLKSVFVPVFLLCLCLAFLGFGCLGVGGGGGSGGTYINPNSNLSISGRAYFLERKLYGNIPIVVKNLQKDTVAITTTDQSGNYSFSDIQPGTYYISASTGESEVTFGNLIQVTDQGATEIPPTSLLCANNIIIDQISSSSFHIKFDTNRACKSFIQYSAVGDYATTKTINQNSKTQHETTVTGLSFLSNYEIVLNLIGDDGQEFVMNGLTANTIGLAGCSNLSVSINNGAYETGNRSVKLYLNADNCSQMRISEDYSMVNTSWISYAPIYSYNFADSTTGIKRIYVQFKNSAGTVSPIQTDSIVYSSTGYLGIWLNDGEALTNQTIAILKAIYPGATQMIISENIDFSGAFWEPYMSSRKWTLTNIDGLKTVYAKFKGGNANPDEVFSASILYDTTPPKAEMIINNGENYIATTSVILHFNSSNLPSFMKISNETEPASSSEWLPYNSTVEWTLNKGDGKKTVYAIFKDAAGNTYGPITSSITIDTEPPSGNNVLVLLSNKIPTDTTPTSLTSVSVTELPCYLHFQISDSSTYKTYYYVGVNTNTYPDILDYKEISEPFNCIQLNQSDDSLIIGDNRIWVYFKDEAGNESYIITYDLLLEGPKIEISPSNVTLKSGQQQSFTYELINTSSSEAGKIVWTASPPVGIITQDGVYTAPSPLLTEENITIKAESSKNPNINGKSTISLQKSIEIAYLQDDGNYSKEPLHKQIQPGETASYNICVLNSEKGIKITSNPSIGYAQLSNNVVNEYGSVATITYYSPANVEYDTTTIHFASNEIATLTGKVGCTIASGANIILTPSSYIAQKNNPITIIAELENPKTTNIIWSISPKEAGSFSPFETQTELGPSDMLYVTFYASEPAKIMQASITARLDGDTASKSINISVYPPIALRIDPVATYAMPIVSDMLFNVDNFDYLIPGTDETLEWHFKNANSLEFMEADGKSYTDRGSLTVVSNNQVLYRRPTKLPSLIDDSASDTILIKATSVADRNASFTAVVNLVRPVTVKIFDDVEKVNEVSTAATVIEVGTLQFYAKVEPDIIGNTSVTWTVNGSSGDSTYGTIDSNGKYTAPSSFDANKAIIRATSNYDNTTYAEVEVTLNEFWVPKREGMVDSLTGESMPISKIFVDQLTSTTEPFVVYAGTGAESQFGYYGLYVATFSSEPGNTDGGYWQPVDNLAYPTRNSNLKYLIYDIVMNDTTIYIGTGDGIYYFPRYFDGQSIPSATKLEGVDYANYLPFTTIDIATKNGEKVILAGCNKGIYMIYLDTGGNNITKIEHLIDTISTYKDPTIVLRKGTRKTIVEGEEKTEEFDVYAHTDVNNTNPINSPVSSLVFINKIPSIYFGTSSSNFYYCNTLEKNLDYYTTGYNVYDSSSGIASHSEIFKVLTRSNYPIADNGIPGVPLALAVNKIYPHTLWIATTGGVAHSIDYGKNWASHPFPNGSQNCSCIIVDYNNTINVMAGSEDGLFRSIDNGVSWTRIRSGLGNYKTITSLTQASGEAGKRRKVWVGTSGGVFIGKEALALE